MTYELREGTYTLPVVSMGGDATLTISAGERLTREQYQAVPKADRSRFKSVRPARTEPDTTDGDAVQ